FLEPLHFDNAGAYADTMNGLLAFFFGSTTKKHKPEHVILIDAGVDHGFVSIFEDMERNDDVRKQNEIGQGEKRYFHLTQRSSDEQLFVLSRLVDSTAASSEEK